VGDVPERLVRQEPPVVKKLIIVALVALGVTAAVKVAKGR
jgi:hypothetical protein